MNGIENITNKIKADAEASAAEIISRAKSEAEEIAASYAARAEEECQKILDRAKKTAESRKERFSGVASQSARRETLAKKQELISRAFELSVERLSSLPDAERAKIVAGLAVAAAGENAGELIFSASEREKIGKTVLESASEKNKNLTLSSETREIGAGVIVKCGDSETNCSFSKLTEEKRTAMSREIADILFG